MITMLLAAMLSVAVVEDRPNVVVFMVDDMGWQDTRCPFTTRGRRSTTSTHARNGTTAAEGMKLTNGYVRTGLHADPDQPHDRPGPARNRITFWTLNRSPTPRVVTRRSSRRPGT